MLQKILLNENFVKSVLLIAAECVLLHHNVSEVLFYKIASKEFLNLDLFEFWKIINPFLNLVSIIDNNVNRHLSEIEIVLFTFLIWMNSENFKDNFNCFVDNNFQGNFYFFLMLNERIKKYNFIYVNFLPFFNF